MTDDVRARWESMPARRRGALIRAVRRGDRVGDDDRALAVEIARREIARITRNASPGRVTVLRVLQGVAAVFLVLVTLAALSVGDGWLAAFYGGGALLFGSSALLARRRLDRQVARLARAIEVNAPAQDGAVEV